MDIIQALVKFQDSITDEIEDIKFREIGSIDPNKQLLIRFKNGLEISIVQGKYTYGGDQGLFEIGIFGKEGEWFPEIFDEEDQGDDVVGYLEPERVNYYIHKVGAYRDT